MADQKTAARPQQLNKGSMFHEENGSLRGNIDIGGENFRCTMTKTEQGGREGWILEGTSPSGDTVESKPFLYINAPEQAASGNPRPEITGNISTTVSRLEMRFAAWPRTGRDKGTPFFSVEISDRRV